jgi:regulatory protein
MSKRQAPPAYAWALQALGRRELTSEQLRQRLARRGCDPADIDTALDRLRRERALDDGRAARAFARTEVTIKRRGPQRIARAMEAMGVDRETARAALDETFAERPVDDVLQQALDRRLRGPIVDDRHAQRLIGYLVRQGFDIGAAVAAVRNRRTG